MKFVSTKILYLILAGMFGFGMTFVGCGGDGEDADSGDGDTTEQESADATMDEGSAASGSYSDRFKDEMIEISKMMIDVAEDVESVEDAENARPKIKESMGRITSMFEDLADNIDKMTMAEVKDLQSMQNIMEDPELKEWTEKAEAATEKLKKEHPDAAKRLEEIGQEEGKAFGATMMSVMMKIGQKLGMGDTATEAETPEEEGATEGE